MHDGDEGLRVDDVHQGDCFNHPGTSKPAASERGTSERDAAAIRQLLADYQDALNAADPGRVLQLYAPDAVLMAQHRPPSSGHAEIEAAYREIFTVIRLDIVFEIDEVVVASPTLAYARTRSVGTTTILASDAQVSEGNQELFLLVRDDPRGDWRIGRYIFSTTQPPRS